MGLPVAFVDMVIRIYNSIEMSIGTKNSILGKVKSNIGVFQGCPLAALLFNCYLADLAPKFHGYGPSLQGERIPCLSYADDLALMAESVPEMQRMLLILEDYCNENKLTINTKKTKILIFRRGPKLPNTAKFFIYGKEIEIVNQFKYLGVVFTTQLKFYAHVEHMKQKAKAKIGMLFAKTTIKEVKLELVLQLFQCYIVPIFEYCLIVWAADFRLSLDKDINSIFLIYLKCWLGLPYSTRSSIVYFLTETKPFVHTLLEKAEEKLGKIEEIKLSLNLNHQEPFLLRDRARKTLDEYKTTELIPTGFWKSEVLKSLPVNYSYRSKTCRRIVDAEHWKICKNNEFHSHSLGNKCKCMFCNEHAEWFHLCD